MNVIKIAAYVVINVASVCGNLESVCKCGQCLWQTCGVFLVSVVSLCCKLFDAGVFNVNVATACCK